MDNHAKELLNGSSQRGNHHRGRPVTERVTLVNMGKRPHRDNGEGVVRHPLTLLYNGGWIL